MKATEHLIREHESVLKMIEIMQAIAGKMEDGENVDPGDLERILDFLRIFVDKCHHGKEENLLFEKLVEIGFSKEAGPVGVMLNEHVQGRAYITGFAEGINKYASGDKSGITAITRNIHGYADLLASHIHKENNILYKMADMHLSEHDQDILLSRFEQLEKEVIGPGKHEEFHKLLQRLSQQYLH
jgi:hemerythrin-like domain-containing protein